MSVSAAGGDSFVESPKQGERSRVALDYDFVR